MFIFNLINCLINGIFKIPLDYSDKIIIKINYDCRLICCMISICVNKYNVTGSRGIFIYFTVYSFIHPL